MVLAREAQSVVARQQNQVSDEPENIVQQPAGARGAGWER